MSGIEFFFITLPAFGRVELLICVRKNSDDEKPSYDFIQQLLTMNAHIEVLEPVSLRDKFKALLQEMLSKY